MAIFQVLMYVFDVAISFYFTRVLHPLEQHTTPANLARQAGTNEFTLKKRFKEIFGTTVFGYWNNLKMEKARHMLLHEDVPVSLVAEKTGYKNQPHFSTAFKKKYGIFPGKLKGNKAN